MSCSPVDAVDESFAWKLSVTWLTLKGTERERWEQVLIVPSTTEMEEKMILAFTIGFRRTWRRKESKKGIFLPFFPPLHSQLKLPSLPQLGSSCGLRRTVLPTGSLHPPGYFFIAAQLFQTWQLLQAGRGEFEERRQGAKVFLSKSKSNTSWSLLSLIPTTLSREIHLVIAFAGQVSVQKICNGEHEGYDLFSLPQEEAFCFTQDE